MFTCSTCKIDFNSQRDYQRHFGFKNANESNHQAIRQGQERIAIDLFNTDLSGDTFYILKNHPEIDLISEKRLRQIWRDAYGSEAIEKRRSSISFNKRNLNDYEPARQRNLEGKDVRCFLCEYRCFNSGELNHHISAMTDDIHVNFYESQRKLAEDIFVQDQQHSFEDISQHYPDFKLSWVVFKNFIKQRFTKVEIKERQYIISSKNRINSQGWKGGLTKDIYMPVLKMSLTKKEQCKNGIPGLSGEALSKILRQRHINDPDIARRQSQTMKNGYASGRLKVPHGKGGTSAELGHYVRSSWELNFGRILKRLNIEYQYEPDVFTFRDESGMVIGSYIPDFYVPSKGKGGVYYEVKGIFNSSTDWGWATMGNYRRFQESAQKIELFRKHRPDLELRIIGKKEYFRLIDRFKLQ